MEWFESFLVFIILVSLFIVFVAERRRRNSINEYLNSDEDTEENIVHDIKYSCDIPDFIEFDYNSSPDDLKIVLGKTYDNKDVVIDLGLSPHTLIAGQTGRGKSNLQNCIVEQMFDKGFKIYGIDFKEGIELNVFKGKMDVICDYEQAKVLLSNLDEEIKLRAVLFKMNGINNIVKFNKRFKEKLSYIILVIDETSEFLEGKKDSEILRIMTRIARIGRAVGIYLLCATQKPSAESIPTKIRSQFSNLISGYTPERTGSEMVLGNDKAMFLNPDIIGRFLLRQTSEDCIEFQSYYFNEEKIKTDFFIKGIVLKDKYMVK